MTRLHLAISRPSSATDVATSTLVWPSLNLKISVVERNDLYENLASFSCCSFLFTVVSSSESSEEAVDLFKPEQRNFNVYSQSRDIFRWADGDIWGKIKTRFKELNIPAMNSDLMSSAVRSTFSLSNLASSIALRLVFTKVIARKSGFSLCCLVSSLKIYRF